MIKHRRSFTLMAAVFLLSIGFGTGAANAASWASSTSPLNASYNGYAYGSGYGTYANSAGRGQSLTYLRDNVSNGNGVYLYGNAKNYVTVKNAGCGENPPCWAYAGSWESTRSQSSSWVTREKFINLTVSGSRSRLIATVCEDAALRPDICSGSLTATFDY